MRDNKKMAGPMDPRTPVGPKGPAGRIQVVGGEEYST